MTGLRVGMAMLTTGGGSSTLALTLGEELASRGVAVRYCHCDPAAPRPLPGAFVLTADAAAETARLLDTDRALVGAIDAASGILAFHDQAPFDLLHLHSLQAFGVPALLLRRVRGVPYVVTMHGSDVLAEHLMDKNLPLVRELLREAAAVTCVSGHLAKVLARKVPDLEGVEVVHNFLQPGFRGDGLRPPGPVPAARFLHVSSLRPVKRPELLLDAFALLRRRLPEARLTLLTTARGKVRGEELLAARGDLGASVAVVDGDAEPGLLARAYRESTALVMTSRFESFGLVILEAMAQGLPAVVPAVGGIPEVVGEDWPWLVREADDPAAYAGAMAAAVAPEAAEAVRRLAPPAVARFDPAAQVEKYLAVYGRALAGRS